MFMVKYITQTGKLKPTKQRTMTTHDNEYLAILKAQEKFLDFLQEEHEPFIHEDEQYVSGGDE